MTSDTRGAPEPSAWMNKFGYFTTDRRQALAHESMGTPLTPLYSPTALAASPEGRALIAEGMERAASLAEDHGEPGMYQGASAEFRSGYEDAGEHIAAAIRAAAAALKGA